MNNTEEDPTLLAVIDAMKAESFGNWLSKGPFTEALLKLAAPVALVFSDIVGSTTVLFELGDDEYDVVLRRHIDRARQLVRDNDGYEIDTTGDGLFCAFHHVPHAFTYARALWIDSGDDRIRIRAGIHYGNTKMRGMNVCGKSVHFASRVMSQGAGPEIWISDEAKHWLPSHCGQWEEFPTCTLKNVPGTYRLWRFRP